MSALLSCHVNELILPCGYWYQNIKFSKNGVIFLWLKNIALGFRMQENIFLQLGNFKRQKQAVGICLTFGRSLKAACI